MLEYYINETAISIELVITSGGISVTGRTPTVEIREIDSSFYWDFDPDAPITGFVANPITTSLNLVSATDGIYRSTWNTFGVFTTNTYLTFEYHDGTAVTIDNVFFRTVPMVTSDINLTVGGGGAGHNIIMQGVFNKTEKEKLFNWTDKIERDIETIRNNVSIIKGKLEDIVLKIGEKRPLTKEDIEILKTIWKKDTVMWQEFLKTLKPIMKLHDTASQKELVEALEEYYKNEVGAKNEVVELLKKLLSRKKKTEEAIEEDEGEE